MDRLRIEDTRKKIKPFSFRPSPLPIALFVPQRSFFAQLPIASAFPRWERPWPSPGILPFALFGQLQSAPELTRTAFDCRFLSRMPYRKLRAPRRCHEVPWQVDLVPSLTDEPLSLDWALISPLGAGSYQYLGGSGLRPVMVGPLGAN